MELLAQRKFCETCGSSVQLDMPSGFCPACLLTTALEFSEPAAAGSRIEDYELLSEIARGGMGIVYRSLQRVPSRIVALKIILPVHLNSPGAVNRFRAEAEAAASLDHESILPIYAVGEHDSAPFYSMKFAEGGTLSARIDNYRDKAREAAALIAKLARAVAFAHEHGILHRDLKPGNVLFDSAGKPYVSDFGLAKWLQRECDLTQTFAVLGTPYYMAPEQAIDSRSVTAAADIYSLGAILYHMLAGRPPFAGETPMEVLHDAATHTPKPPRLTNRRVPRDLETICLKCLEKEPASRYVSAAALADDLEHFCAGQTIQARPAGLTHRAWRWTRRNPLTTGLAIAAVASLMAAGFFVLHPQDHTAPPPVTEKSIAVLPFENLSEEKANEFFADGVQDEILADLAKIADLKVISRTSVMQYKSGTRRNLREIGQQLGVAHVVEGSVQRVGNRVRVNAQLIDARNDAHLWAQTYDRDLADVFQIQSDISQAIVTQLKAALSPAEKAAIEEKPTQDKEAYDLYLRARSLVYGQSGLSGETQAENATKAVTLLESAITRDSKFMLAYCVLGDAQLNLDYFVGGEDEAPLFKAKEAIGAALRISPNSAEAHLVLARYSLHGLEDVSATEKELAIAAAGLPGRVDVFDLRAEAEEQQGKWKEALRDREKAADLDPRDADTGLGLGVLYITLRRYGDAERLLDHMIATAPQQSTAPLWELKSNIALAKGDAKAAMAALDACPDRNLGNWGLNQRIVNVFVMERDYTKAEGILQSIDETAKTHNAVPGGDLNIFQRGRTLERLGRLARFWGEKDKARGYFEAARPNFEQWVAKNQKHNTYANSWWQSHSLGYIAEIDAALGRKEDAIREAKSAVELWSLKRNARIAPHLEIFLAIVYMWAGERDAALEQLGQMAKLPAESVWINCPAGASAGDFELNPLWDELRNDPRFDKIIAEAAKPIKLD
jgi:serine/threonine protein kinase/tetratricopeptide (TPR) repeat protein